MTRSSGTIFYSLLYFNSQRGYFILEYLYPVLSVKMVSLPANTKNTSGIDKLSIPRVQFLKMDSLPANTKNISGIDKTARAQFLVSWVVYRDAYTLYPHGNLLDIQRVSNPRIRPWKLSGYQPRLTQIVENRKAIRIKVMYFGVYGTNQTKDCIWGPNPASKKLLGGPRPASKNLLGIAPWLSHTHHCIVGVSLTCLHPVRAVGGCKDPSSTFWTLQKWNRMPGNLPGRIACVKESGRLKNKVIYYWWERNSRCTCHCTHAISLTLRISNDL